jgi:transcriptional regulator with XRE-family HTH domain
MRARVSVKKPNDVDAHVGRRLRARRQLVGWSQEELAKRLGLTAQQVQKYEAGETRVSASRLYEVARHLGCPITYFFQEINADTVADDEAVIVQAAEPEDPLGALMGTREAREIVEAYFNIPDRRLRKKLLEMAGLLTRTTSG